MNPLPPLPVEIVQHGFPWSAFWVSVQAIGSLIALAVAVGIPRWQAELEQKRVSDAVLAYAKMVHEAVTALAIYSGDYNVVAYKLPIQQASVELKLPMIIAASERLPLERLRSAKAADTFLRLLGAAQTYQAELARPSDLTPPEDTINGFTVRRFAADRVKELESLLRENLS
jgi:hypothetical protein